MLLRVFAALVTVLATTFGGPTPRANAAPELTALAIEPALVDDVVGAFGDDLDRLHQLMSYEADARDAARIDRVCAALLADYPAFKAAVGARGTDLLVAAESFVGACRGGFATTLDTDAFEIIDGDYITFRELAFAFE